MSDKQEQFTQALQKLQQNGALRLIELGIDNDDLIVEFATRFMGMDADTAREKIGFERGITDTHPAPGDA